MILALTLVPNTDPNPNNDPNPDPNTGPLNPDPNTNPNINTDPNPDSSSRDSIPGVGIPVVRIFKSGFKFRLDGECVHCTLIDRQYSLIGLITNMGYL